MQNDYIHMKRLNERDSYVAGVGIVVAVIGLWLKVFAPIAAFAAIFVLLLILVNVVKRSYEAMLSGGEEKLIELLEAKNKNDEYSALVSLYRVTEPIAARLPDEAIEHKYLKLEAYKKEMEAEQN